MNNVSPSDIAEIVQKYTPYIKIICQKYYIVGGTKEDLYEEGLIGLLEACKNYNGESVFEDRFEPFAKLCIKRQILDAIKKSNAQKNKALNESVGFISTIKDGEEVSKLDFILDRSISSDPLELFIDKEKVDERLQICEQLLSEFEKEVLNHYLSGEKQSEIAKKLNKEVKSIDNTIQRIKSKLK